MNVAVFGGLSRRPFPPGWTKETVVAIFRAGFGLFGGREVKVSQRGDGPEIKMNLWVFLGGIEVKEQAPTAAT